MRAFGFETVRFTNNLVREAEMHDVAVLHNVIFALKPHPAGVARSGFSAACHVIVVSDGLGADKATLEIGVNDASGLRRLRSAGNSPGPRLLRPGGEESDEIEQRIAGADKPIGAGLGQFPCSHITLALIARERGDLSFNFR